MDVAARAGSVERGHKLSHRGQARRTGCPDQQRVGARISHDRNIIAGVGRSTRHRDSGASGEQLGERARDIGRSRMLELDDLQVALGHIDRGNDAGDALDVVGVVGHHQCVVGGIGRNRVVGRNQRADHRHHLRGRFVLQREYLGDDACARVAPLAAGDRHRVQLGVGLGYDLGDARRLDRGVALQTQRREQDVVGKTFRHWRIGGDVEIALDPRIDEEIAPGDLADRLDDRLDLRVGKVQRYRVAVGGRLGGNRHGQGGREQQGAETLEGVVHRHQSFSVS